jgi:hypothetical protein
MITDHLTESDVCASYDMALQDNRFGGLDARITAIERDLMERLPPKGFPYEELRGLVTKAPTEPWLKRHWIAASGLVLAVIGAVFGTGSVVRFFVLSMDSEIDSKLKDPLKDLHQIQIDVAKIGVRLELRDKAQAAPESFQHDLPAVAAAIKSAVDLSVSSPEDVKDSLQQQ